MRNQNLMGILIVLSIIFSLKGLQDVQATIVSSSSEATSSSTTESSEISSSSVDETVVLAVNEAVGFQSATNYSTNYRSVGSTFFNNSNKFVYLSNGAGYTAGSFFTKNKVFLTNSTSAGFSTFFEMTVYGAGGGYADGFTFIVSRDINVLGSAGGAIGYGGINNSIAVLFDNYNNGGQPPLCLSLGVNGGQGNCQYSGFYSGNLKIWIDYSRNTNGGLLEVRMHNRTDFNRPANPVRTWENISFNQIGNEFYTGFTAATGGEAQVAFLRSWYFSASYLPLGIDPTDAANFVTDNVPPGNPAIEPYLINGEWFFKPEAASLTEQGLSFLYTQGNNQQYTFYNAFTSRATFASSDQTLYLYALDDAGNRSPGAGTYSYFRANYILNYPGAISVTRFYPGYQAKFPITESIDLLIPERPGYRFLGWALNPIQTTGLIFNYQFLSNANFFARWEFNPYTVNFNVNGGTAIEPINTDINRGFTLPEPPTKANHSFVGWYLDADFNEPLNLNEFPHTTLTLFAKWDINTHVLTIENQIEQSQQTFTYDYGTTINTASLAPSPRDGFVFVGFYQDAALTQLLPMNVVLVGDRTIYEKWIDIRPVAAFHQAVVTIKEPLTTAVANQEALATARAAYTALTNEQVAYVDETVLAKLATLEKTMADLLAVEAAVLVVDQLDRIMTLDGQSALQQAIQTYANLTPDQQALFPSDRLHHLDDLAAQYSDLSEANAVEVLVWEIPTTLNVQAIDAIEAAVAAFDALLPTEVAMMDPAVVSKLNEAKGQLNQLRTCQTFIELVQAIGPEVTFSDTDAIDAAFAFYQGMNDEALVYLDYQYYQFLLTYSKQHQDMTLAMPVNAMLEALPSEIKLTDESQVNQALAAFESLSEDQQQYIDEELVSALRSALNEIERLKSIDDGGPVDPPIDPEVSAYFPWIIIIVVVAWVGGYLLVQKKPTFIP
jgi:uncharacterized repeat protein (TIGR02543 family)